MFQLCKKSHYQLRDGSSRGGKIVGSPSGGIKALDEFLDLPHLDILLR
jgi:hypothetical protein